MLLEVKGLKTYFREGHAVTKAVDDISFGIDDDEVVGLVGESGSGKTMTGLSIMRLVPAPGRTEGGEIIFRGKDLLKLEEAGMLAVRGQKISMIFQEPFTSLNPVFCIGEQISEVIEAHKGVSKNEAQKEAMGLLESVRMKDAERVFFDYPHQLSGGQRQRAMIAAAIAVKPEILIADEPTTALDVTIQSEILKLLSELKAHYRMSVLFITHDFGIVSQTADRVLVMKDGKIVESGRKSDILKFPRHPYTKKLLDAIPKIETEAKPPLAQAGPFIEIKNVSKSYRIERGFLLKKAGEIEAVRGVTLVLKRSATLGLVGESACGKTTLGKLILGLLKKDSGEILIEKKPIEKALKDTPKRIRQMMQIVFQDPYGSLDPRMRMKDIVLEGPAILGIKKGEREEIFKKTVEMVNLEYKDALKYPAQFSGGQRQRVAIARALAVGPEFLVLDEPVSSLDVLIQSGILELLKKLQRTLGLTYLFISHDLRVVGHMADEVAVMYRGEIIETASAGQIFRAPQHPYTKRLLSSLPII